MRIPPLKLPSGGFLRVRCIREGLGAHPKVTFQKPHFLTTSMRQALLAVVICYHISSRRPCQVAFVSLFPRLHPFLLIVEEMG